MAGIKKAPEIKCPHCPQKFPTGSEVLKHIRKVHKKQQMR